MKNKKEELIRLRKISLSIDLLEKRMNTIDTLIRRCENILKNEGSS